MNLHPVMVMQYFSKKTRLIGMSDVPQYHVLNEKFVFNI